LAHGVDGGASLDSYGDVHADSLLAMLERVQAARATAQGNVNPQLLLAVLGQELAAAAK
jgi:hypothetical protein